MRDSNVVSWLAITGALVFAIAVGLVAGSLYSPPASVTPASKSESVAVLQEAYSLGASGVAAGFSVTAIQSWAGETARLLDRARQVRVDEGASVGDRLLDAIDAAYSSAVATARQDSPTAASSARSATLTAIYSAIQSSKYQVAPAPLVPLEPLGLPRKPATPDAPRPAPEPTPPMPAIPPVKGVR